MTYAKFIIIIIHYSRRYWLTYFPYVNNNFQLTQPRGHGKIINFISRKKGMETPLMRKLPTPPDVYQNRFVHSIFTPFAFTYTFNTWVKLYLVWTIVSNSRLGRLKVGIYNINIFFDNWTENYINNKCNYKCKSGNCNWLWKSGY